MCWAAHLLVESGVKGEIVVGGVPGEAQGVGGQDDEADGPTGKRLHFDSVGEGQERVAFFEEGGPGEQILLYYVE